MSASGENTIEIRIIACGVFKPALQYLRLEEKIPQVKISYLPSVLHLRPPDLKNFLQKEIQAAHNRDEKVICLYGDCFPDIDDFCKQYHVLKVPGSFCYEMFLGPDRFCRMMDEMAGTYFMEKDLIVNFEQHCVAPLELNDKTMRKYCFEHYKRLIYVRQPDDPDLLSRVDEIAEFLELIPDVRDADYSFLYDKLLELIEGDA